MKCENRYPAIRRRKNRWIQASVTVYVNKGKVVSLEVGGNIQKHVALGPTGYELAERYTYTAGSGFFWGVRAAMPKILVTSEIFSHSSLINIPAHERSIENQATMSSAHRFLIRAICILFELVHN